MKWMAVIISLAWASGAQAADAPSIFRQPDPQIKFQEAQAHVKELMDAGQYKEASEFMPIYQRLSCEASEQRAGRSIEEGTAICAQKHQRGMDATLLPQQENSAANPAPSNLVAPGISVMERHVPGSPTLLDGSAPSLFMFDPRTDPGSETNPQRNGVQMDPWTGAR